MAMFLKASTACECLYMNVYMHTLLVTKDRVPEVCSCPELM